VRSLSSSEKGVLGIFVSGVLAGILFWAAFLYSLYSFMEVDIVVLIGELVCPVFLGLASVIQLVTTIRSNIHFFLSL
jgi:hypothetical protein